MTAALFSELNEREALEKEWLDLTRHRLPHASRQQGWPIRHDHCFQRVLLDNACGGVWYTSIKGRPAYKAAPAELLRCAIALGLSAAEGRADLHVLNDKSLAWRGQRSAAGSL